ncbi:hypothetical protein ADUPG1_010018, partial [Aduncisulcus paluster]
MEYDESPDITPRKERIIEDMSWVFPPVKNSSPDYQFIIEKGKFQSEIIPKDLEILQSYLPKKVHKYIDDELQYTADCAEDLELLSRSVQTRGIDGEYSPVDILLVRANRASNIISSIATHYPEELAAFLDRNPICVHVMSQACFLPTVQDLILYLLSGTIVDNPTISLKLFMKKPSRQLLDAQRAAFCEVLCKHGLVTHCVSRYFHCTKFMRLPSLVATLSSIFTYLCKAGFLHCFYIQQTLQGWIACCGHRNNNIIKYVKDRSLEETEKLDFSIIGSDLTVELSGLPDDQEVSGGDKEETEIPDEEFSEESAEAIVGADGIVDFETKDMDSETCDHPSSETCVDPSSMEMIVFPFIPFLQDSLHIARVIYTVVCECSICLHHKFPQLAELDHQMNTSCDDHQASLCKVPLFGDIPEEYSHFYLSLISIRSTFMQAVLFLQTKKQKEKKIVRILEKFNTKQMSEIELEIWQEFIEYVRGKDEDMNDKSLKKAEIFLKQYASEMDQKRDTVFTRVHVTDKDISQMRDTPESSKSQGIFGTIILEEEEVYASPSSSTRSSPILVPDEDERRVCNDLENNRTETGHLLFATQDKTYSSYITAIVHHRHFPSMNPKIMSEELTLPPLRRVILFKMLDFIHHYHENKGDSDDSSSCDILVTEPKLENWMASFLKSTKEISAFSNVKKTEQEHYFYLQTDSSSCVAEETQ